MAILLDLKEALETGDPMIRSWSLVKSTWTPFLVSAFYLFFIKRLGPTLMKNRRPFDLRLVMIVYNFSIVALYVGCILTVAYYFFTTDVYKYVCKPLQVRKDSYLYSLATIAWIIYVLKYVELFDTVFFVLRKRFDLITNLHVIHHMTIPIIAWVLLRTETSGFQFIPVYLNSIVHIIMYLYYGLAAMGPEVQRRLWWKEHLTQLQMLQFVVIVFLFLIIPISGCQTHRYGFYMDGFFGTLFLGLFYNFYRNTYLKKKNQNSAKIANGKQKSS